jgi:hypothetical protein
MGKKKRIKIDWEMPEFFYSEDEDLIRYKSRFEYLRNGSGLLRLIPWSRLSGYYE